MRNGSNLETDVSGGDEPEIIGYTVPWIASPGETVEVKASPMVAAYLMVTV